MTKRRFRPPGYSVSTRGHSVLPRGTYGFAPRRFAGEGYVPEYVPRKTYDTSYEEYALDSAVTNATSFSDASLFENFDTASRSRGRDQKLISDATAAIVHSEPHAASPRASAAVRRVARKPPAPPRPVFYKQEVVRPLSAEAPVYSYSPPRPRSVIVVGARSPWQGVYVVPVGPRVRAPSYFEERAQRAQSAPPDPGSFVYRGQPLILPSDYYYSRPYRAQAPPRYFRLRYPQSGYVTYRKPRRAKAAIVASKVEVEPRKKRPRSKFAADKLRATRVRGEESAGHDASTSGLHASRPPLPLPSERRAIRDVEGFTKPRNLLSWQYRIESRMDPTDIIYKPGSFTRMRAQVRDAHDKLDRHRQLLDRYLTDGVPAYDVQSSVQRKMEDMERRDPGSKKKY